MGWKRLGAVVVVLAASLAPAAPASAHDLGADSVDGREIRYEDYTKWDTARNSATSDWNGLGCVNIAPDNSSTVTDLEFRDYYDNNTSTLGYWTTRIGADRIYFNDYHFNQMSSGEREKTSLHELGHALRLAHNTTSGSVMRQGRFSQTYPGSHDVSDYRARWC